MSIFQIQDGLPYEKVHLYPFNFKNIWQSPLHKDVFATLGTEFVKLNAQTWQYEVLAKIGILNSVMRSSIILFILQVN
jgi:hypothetical protein